MDVERKQFEVVDHTVMFITAPANGLTVRIYRNTPTQRLVSWADASILKAKDMTVAEVQQLHLIEEGQDWYKTKSMTLDEDILKWEARNYPIQNLADPTNEQDAATMHYLKNAFMIETVRPTINEYFNQSNMSIYTQRAKEYMEKSSDYADISKKWAEMAKDQALTCARWQIGAVRDRESNKPDYGLNNVDLIINVPDLVKLNVIGDSEV